MNKKTVFTGITVCVVALFVAMQYGQAAPSAAVPASKIGLVSVREALSGSKKHVQYQSQMLKRQSQASAQLDELAKQLSEEEAELKTRLKPGTPEYLKQYQVVLEARAKLQNQQEMTKQQLTVQNKEWLENIYQEILKAVNDLAKEKGLDLVLERTEPKFPMASEEAFTTISTHKVLYCPAGVDLTNEVSARVDASANLKP
jgi:Skp family chaperone for outer membrane proteins